ncbi:hypothetical protein BC629DRAFT_395157 [Irpex lacteus]|nr:hypothetical protein BC629DRAFT_395157 [Irpex lacteus]
MPNTGPLTIAAAVDDSGVRLYTKLADATVVVEHNPTTQRQIEVAQRSEDKSTMQEVRPWSRQPGNYKCDPSSALCTYTWDGNVAVFHENNGQLHYWLDDRARQCMHGTQIAVTGDDKAGEITLFYQDKAGYLCYRVAKSMIWDEPVVMGKAVNGTGIAAVSWSGNKQIRVYYQDEHFNILERAYSKDTWNTNGIGMATAKGLTTIGAVHWFGDETGQTELRVYFQLGQSGIQERCWSAGQGWHGSVTKFTYLNNMQADLPTVGASFYTTPS